MHVSMYACMYACMHVCMYARMHTCVYACMPFMHDVKTLFGRIRTGLWGRSSYFDSSACCTEQLNMDSLRTTRITHMTILLSFRSTVLSFKATFPRSITLRGRLVGGSSPPACALQLPSTPFCRGTRSCCHATEAPSAGMNAHCGSTCLRASTSGCFGQEAGRWLLKSGS